MRQLRAVAAVLALAVIWLAFSVAREMAAERSSEDTVGSATAPASAQDEPGPHSKVSKPAAPGVAEVPDVPDANMVALALGEPFAIADDTPAAEPMPAEPAHVPFLQSALQEMQANGPSGVNGRSGGAFGGGYTPSIWGGIAGGASADLPLATDDAGLPGDGRTSVLGHRFSETSAETSDNNGSTGSNDQNGDANGNNGSAGANGSNDRNGDANGNGGNNGSSNAGSSNAGGSNDNGGNNNASETGGTAEGGDKGGSPESGTQTLAANLESEGGDDDVRDVPEPGSILVGLGAVAALVRRRLR